MAYTRSFDEQEVILQPPCMYLRSKDESQYLQDGDKIRIGKWRGKVIFVDPQENAVRIESEDGEEYLLRLGEALADAVKASTL